MRTWVWSNFTYASPGFIMIIVEEPGLPPFGLTFGGGVAEPFHLYEQLRCAKERCDRNFPWLEIK